MPQVAGYFSQKRHCKSFLGKEGYLPLLKKKKTCKEKGSYLSFPALKE